jgi:predicted amino acid racemase
MPGPQVTIDLEKIENNTKTVVSWCAKAGISIFGVTKGSCGMPQVAHAMLRGGVAGLGESRLENIRRLRESGIEAKIMLRSSARSISVSIPNSPSSANCRASPSAWAASTTSS